MKVLKFNEAQLNLKELEKDSKDGFRRGDVLVKKIKNKEELKTNKNGIKKDIIVQNSDEILPQITDSDGNYDVQSSQKYFLKSQNRYKEDAIKGDDDENYKLNDLEKTSDFGSNRGSGLGTIDTRYVESIQCLFFAYRQRVRKPLTNEDVSKLLNLSDRTFERLKRFVDIGDMKIDKSIISKFKHHWTPTFVKIANVIYQPGTANSGFKNDLLIDPNRIYKFCQISTKDGVVKAIKDKFYEYERVSISKWNPADVWAIDIYTEDRTISSIKNCKSISELSDLITNLFDQKKLIGISLKKVSEKENVKLIVNKMTKIPIYKFESVKVAEDSLSTIGVKITAHRFSEEFGPAPEYMTVRSFGGPNKIQNISGEIEGKSARHGKISLTKINQILVEILSKVEGCNIETVTSATSEFYYEDNLSSWTDEELMDEIEAINQKIIRKYGDITSYTSKKVKMTRSRLISKYQSLFLAWILMENQNIPYNRMYSVSDKIVGMMFQYALSINLTGKKSGRTPKYARIID